MCDLSSHARRIRTIGTARWRPGQMQAGDWRFNTHHQVYQFALPPHGTFVPLLPHLVEWNPAQLNRWLSRLNQARGLVETTLLEVAHADLR